MLESEHPCETAGSFGSMEFTKPKYSKGKVRRAGKVLAGRLDQGMTWEEAVEVASNWRSSHAYPTFVVRTYLNQRLSKMGLRYTIATRTKKMPTIISKLSENIIKDLSLMQDIGGCRIIVDSADEAIRVAKLLENGKTKAHRVSKQKDYFENPKESGYRGVHLISKYNSKDKPEFPGMLVETQVRTKLVHNWATTIEAIDLMKGSSLKRSQGSVDWKRFFYLVADRMARDEKTPRVVTDIPGDVVDAEIRELRDRLGIVNEIRGWEQVNEATSFADGVGDWFIVVLSASIGTYLFPQIIVFASSEDAEEEYEKYERDPNVNAVSVSAADMAQVRKAYPNYFLDCSDFRAYIEKI